LKLRAFIPALIIAAGIWAYHNSFQGSFVFDDVTSIAENPHIRHLWPISEAMKTSPNFAIQGRPVECLSLALNYAWGGLNVRGYHVLNLMLHLASALVLFGLLRRTLLRTARSGDPRRTGVGETDAVGTPHATPAAATWLAAAITLIWEVHPLQTDSVTYIVQRSELLMGLFLMLTLYCFVRGVEGSGSVHREDSPRAAGASPSRSLGWFALSVAACFLGMGSKETMVGAPLIVLVYDRVFLASSFRELWRRRMGLYVGLASSWLLLAALVARTVHPMTGVRIEGLTPWEYLMTEAGVIVYYLRLCFWPQPLVIDYFDWPIVRSLRDALLPGLVVVGLLGATVWAFRRRPWLGFLGAWFFLILAPTSSFLPSAGEMIAERRMYSPLAAVITLVVVGVFVLGRRLWNKRQGTALGCVGTACVVMVFGFLTIQRNRDYRSALAIWGDTVEKRPGNPRAHNNLGLAFAKLGRLDDAEGQYEQALRIKPDLADAQFNWGLALVRQGRVPEAIGHWEQALRIKPDFADAQYNLGLAFAQQGRLQEAISHWEKALRIDPNIADAQYNWGLALEKLGRSAEAIPHYREALRTQPDLGQARDALARLEIRQ